MLGSSAIEYYQDFFKPQTWVTVKESWPFPAQPGIILEVDWETETCLVKRFLNNNEIREDWFHYSSLSVRKPDFRELIRKALQTQGLL